MENKYSNKYVIETGIGLQDVDNLKNSSYFISESERYIKGEISLSELEDIVSSYYKNKPEEDERTEEADIIAVRIAKLISDDNFIFSIGQFVYIHKFLFEGVFNHAGKIRDFNFIKKEWVLDGASVFYADYNVIETALDFDFLAEKRFNYSGLSMDEIIEHLAIFIANLWQVHAFQEGNTRTTAVFVIKYLRSLGFDVTNDAFAKNAWYFRNALVRANYKHIRKGVIEDRSFLIKFLRNLLLNEKNPLHNKEMHISLSDQQLDLGVRETKIVSLMKNKPNIKTEEIADELGVSLRTVKSLIAVLEKDEIIQRTGGKKFGYWQVNISPKAKE